MFTNRDSQDNLSNNLLYVEEELNYKNNLISSQNDKQQLNSYLSNSIDNFLKNPENKDSNELYELYLSTVEAPLFRNVLAHVRGNQSKAAKLMGINRGTLRKKLKKYGII
ncbi:MAG: helix-turn-helix domain-containing protein [Ruminobacter sp.]|nr:helix-turn-helix domain-containing protein [Ruminobacter sp.]